MDIEILKDIVLRIVPRVLGFADRREDSKTFGCFDRTYWHYKVTDFPNARRQEVSLLLALLYLNDFPGNRYFQQPLIKKLALAAVTYWSKIQNPNGSLNEVFPFEMGYCVTAMSSFYASETLLLLSEKSDIDWKKTGDWLWRHENAKVSNQQAASALALWNFGKLRGEGDFYEKSRRKMAVLLAAQADEGWYPEYGGWDYGYQSITLGLLQQLYWKNKDAALKASIQSGVRWLASAIDPEGNYDNRGSSRNTKYLYPFIFSVYETEVLERLCKGLKDNVVLSPEWMDDRYVGVFALDYFMAYLSSKDREGRKLG